MFEQNYTNFTIANFLLLFAFNYYCDKYMLCINDVYTKLNKFRNEF